MTKNFQHLRQDLSSIQGARVTDFSGFTPGRWYILFTEACGGAHIHAKFKEVVGEWAYFDVCLEDQKKFGLKTYVKRYLHSLRSYLPAWKFATHPTKKALPDAPRLDALPGSRYVVAESHSDRFQKGDVWELIHNDGTARPWFTKVRDDGTLETATQYVNRCVSWSRLAILDEKLPQAATTPARPKNETSAGTFGQRVDDYIAAVQAATAKAVHHEDRANGLEEQARTKRTEAEALDKQAREERRQASAANATALMAKQQLEQLLRGYLPDINSPIQPTPLSTGGIDPRPYGKLD